MDCLSLVHTAAQIQEPADLRLWLCHETANWHLSLNTKPLFYASDQLYHYANTIIHVSMYESALFQLLDDKFKPVQLQNSNVLTNDAFNGCRKQEASMSAGSRGTGEHNAHHSTSKPQPLTPQHALRHHTTSTTTAASALTTQHALRGLLDHINTTITTGTVHALENTPPAVPCRSTGHCEASWALHLCVGDGAGWARCQGQIWMMVNEVWMLCLWVLYVGSLFSVLGAPNQQHHMIFC